MHLLVPFASALSEAAVHTLRDLQLPRLQKLLTLLAPAARCGDDEYTLTPPHERALAEALGLRGEDGRLPWGARQARLDGIAVDDRAWALMTPVHWAVGSEQVTLVDPATLALTEAESREHLEAIRHLFESEGFTLAYGAPTRWYAAHDSLAALPTASLDRVIGRNVDLWLAARAESRLVRRLQNEVQMLLYQHPAHDARVARGELPLNSFWLSGCGREQPDAPASEPPVVDERLRTPLLAGDWAAWAEAWAALDAERIAPLLAKAQRGEAVALTLCGERYAQRFEPAPRTLWQRLTGAGRGEPLPAVLESL
jgi:hypothetical protein